MSSFSALISQVQDCSICTEHLPHGVRPVLQITPHARILIAGQAPGKKVHESGVPFNDASGERLRQWMGISREIFYDSQQIAILPMGFCFPGSGKSGDLPPRPECALAWRSQLLAQLKNIELSLVIGQYAQNYHLNSTRKTLTEVVQDWRDYWPKRLPLPHPSPRNNIWLKRNPWFEKEIIPTLQKRIINIL